MCVCVYKTVKDSTCLLASVICIGIHRLACITETATFKDSNWTEREKADSSLPIFSLVDAEVIYMHYALQTESSVLAHSVQLWPSAWVVHWGDFSLIGLEPGRLKIKGPASAQSTVSPTHSRKAGQCVCQRARGGQMHCYNTHHLLLTRIYSQRPNQAISPLRGAICLHTALGMPHTFPTQ